MASSTGRKTDSAEVSIHFHASNSAPVELDTQIVSSPENQKRELPRTLFIQMEYCGQQTLQYTSLSC